MFEVAIRSVILQTMMLACAGCGAGGASGPVTVPIKEAATAIQTSLCFRKIQCGQSLPAACFDEAETAPGIECDSTELELCLTSIATLDCNVHEMTPACYLSCFDY